MKKTFKQYLLEIADIENPTFGDDKQKTVKFRREDDSKFMKHINNMSKNPKFRYMGRGSQAIVNSIDDPHEQDKVVRTAPKQDAGTKWYEYISSHPELHNNPFVPKVLKTSKSNSYPSYEIEKLLPSYTDVITGNEELWKSLMKRYFNNSDYINSPFDIGIRLENVIKRGDWDKIKDPQLVDALQTILVLKQKWGAELDIHDENFMWRMTPTGPQLVITDPLWFPDH